MSSFGDMANRFDVAIPSIEVDDTQTPGLTANNPILIEATPSPVLWGRFRRTPKRDPTPLLFQSFSPDPNFIPVPLFVPIHDEFGNFVQYVQNLPDCDYSVPPAYSTQAAAIPFQDSQEWLRRSPEATYPETTHYQPLSRPTYTSEDLAAYPTGASAFAFPGSLKWLPRSPEAIHPEPIHYMLPSYPPYTSEDCAAYRTEASEFACPDSQEWLLRPLEATQPERTHYQLPRFSTHTPGDPGYSSSHPIWISESPINTSKKSTFSQYPQTKPTIPPTMDAKATRSSASPEREHETHADLSHPVTMAGDIESAMPAPIPETTAPLSVRSDNDSISHSHTAVRHSHAEPLLPHQQLRRDGEATAQTIHPGALTVDTPEGPPGSVLLGPAEFAVTLPMDSRVKDNYERILSAAAEDVREFLASFLSRSQEAFLELEYLWSKMEELAQGLNNVSTHPDLNIPLHLMEADSNLETQASWAEYSSAKFLLLGHLIDIASGHDLHLILAVEHERKQKLIERYLRGKGFVYTRPREAMGSGLEVSLAKGPLSFGIHTSENVKELLKAPSAIFAFDTSFNPQSPSVQHIRTTYTRKERPLPIIWLMVANSCEHIQRCLPDLSETDEMRSLVLHTARLHEEVGDLQDGAFGMRENAEKILEFLLDSSASWSLPTVAPLDLVSLTGLESSSPSSGTSDSRGRKRSLPEEDVGDPTSKRARVGTYGASRTTASSSLEHDLAQLRAAHAVEKYRMQNELTEKNSQLQATAKVLGLLQHRYESRTQELHKTRQERDHIMVNRSLLEERVEKFREEVLKLKEERTELKCELAEARQALKAGGGTLGDLETAREEIRRLAKESAGLERKADYERNQAEYTRDQYQNASTAAAQAGNELRQLRSEIENLTRMVRANANELREINKKDDSARHVARIHELELILATRNDLLRRKEEELREIRKNRPSTRSTSSQPRSPKWAAGSRPTSPGIANNGNGGNGNNGLAGRGSALRFSSEVPF